MVQQYENYWKLTVEYTNIHSDKFIQTLKLCVNFIDNEINTPYSPQKYKQLQTIVGNKFSKKDFASVRKSINQFVKLGFIKPFLSGYHPKTKEFLNAPTKRKRQRLFSEVFYKNSKFLASVTNDSSYNQVSFIIKTLEEVGKLNKEQLLSLMTVNTNDYLDGFLTIQELQMIVEETKHIKFLDRKYNQFLYLCNFLSKLSEIKFYKEELYFEDDLKEIYENYSDKKIRDQYLHRLYKKELKIESMKTFNTEKPICMLDKKEYPTLIASHIKPFIDCNDNEAYDVNNGLLLNQNLDGLFDKKHISFDPETGHIIFNQKKPLSPDLVECYKDYQIDKSLLNSERKHYLKYHNSLLN